MGKKPTEEAWLEAERLARVSMDNHALLYKDAMTGQGIDRHLFALRVVAYGMNVESRFLTRVFDMPWSLSTSQQPQQQEPSFWKLLKRGENGKMGEFEKQWSPGGGFGPVADDGYGVSYMVAGEDRLFFHVSSKFSSKHTSSPRFRDEIKNALTDLKLIFTKATAL